MLIILSLDSVNPGSSSFYGDAPQPPVNAKPRDAPPKSVRTRTRTNDVVNVAHRVHDDNGNVLEETAYIKDGPYPSPQMDQGMRDSLTEVVSLAG